jgi:small nuclear ribonucleoprotein (snRNP)-like protein
MTYEEFMPHWKKQDQCFEDEQIEVTDREGRRVTQKGKPVIKAWPHDKPTAQIVYEEEWLSKVVNPETNEWYPARNKDGNAIRNTGGKHIVRQIIRIRRKDGSEFLYSLGTLYAFDAFGNVVDCDCAKPEVWTRTLFNHERVYDQRTNTTKIQTSGTLGTEDVYEMPFNEKNLKELVSLRGNDSDIQFTIKDEANGKATEVRKDVNISKTLELFLKPFHYLANAEYITPQQRAQLRQMAIDEGIIAPNTPLAPEDTNTPPPKGTCS